MKSLASFFLLTALSISINAQKKADLTYNLELNKVYRAKNTASKIPPRRSWVTNNPFRLTIPWLFP